jgi:hypothetical protein
VSREEEEGKGKEFQEHLEVQPSKNTENVLPNGSDVRQEPLNQRTYHADDFHLAPVVVVTMH